MSPYSKVWGFIFGGIAACLPGTRGARDWGHAGGCSGVDEVGVAAVGFADSASEVVGSGWLEDQMYVIWHEAVGPDGDVGLASLLSQQVEVDFMVAVFKEDGFAPVSALGYVMGKSGDHDSSETCHVGTIALMGE